MEGPRYLGLRQSRTVGTRELLRHRDDELRSPGLRKDGSAHPDPHLGAVVVERPARAGVWFLRPLRLPRGWSRTDRKETMTAQKLTNRVSGAACTQHGAGGLSVRDGDAPAGRPAEMPRLQGPSRGRCAEAGFTLIELMVVVIIIGILATIAIPNFINLRARADEGVIKSNMHTVQMSVEDFAIQNDGDYPTTATAALPDGRTLGDVCPLGYIPINPFTRSPSVIQYNADPSAGNKGEMALNPALSTNYVIKGNGAKGSLLPLSLTSGQ